MIAFKCSCGKALKVKDEAAGKRVRCPACKQVIPVPAPQPKVPKPAKDIGVALDSAKPEDDADFGLQDYEPEHGEHRVEGEGKHCPACHMLLPQSALLCTICGHDFRTGKVYEEPKSIAEKIPWKLIVKWTCQIAALVLVGLLGWWAYTTATKEDSGDNGKDEGGTKAQLNKRAKHMRRPPVLKLVTKTKYLKPLPGKGFTLKAADGSFTPEEAYKELRAKIVQEARGRLQVAGHKVLKTGESKGFGSGELLTVRLELTIGWEFAKSGDTLVPTTPFVAWCQATMVRDDDRKVWPDAATEATFSAKRAGATPTDAQAAAIAKLTEAKTDAKVADVAAQLAAAVVGRILNVVPPPSYLAKLLSEAGAKPEARSHSPDKQLLGALKAKFTGSSDTFKSELPVLEAAAGKTPHIALAFARTAAALERDGGTKTSLRALCERLEANRPTLPEAEADALAPIAEQYPETCLGRMALWTLLSSDYRLSWTSASHYFVKLASRQLPTVDGSVTGALTLSPRQLEMVGLLVKWNPAEGCDAALDLLLHVPGSQCDALWKHVKLPKPDPELDRRLRSAFSSGNKSTILHAIKRDANSGDRGRPYLPLLIKSYRSATDPEVRATFLFAILMCSSHPQPCLSEMLRMVRASDVATRRAAAKGFYLSGTWCKSVADELEAILATEKDGTVRTHLKNALGRARRRG